MRTQGAARTERRAGRVRRALAAAQGLHIHRLDAHALFDAMVADPAAFGLTNVTDGCTSLFVAQTPCTSADRYLFWDEVHPTTAVHALLAAEALQAVPEPAALLLMAPALGATGVGRALLAGRPLPTPPRSSPDAAGADPGRRAGTDLDLV